MEIITTTDLASYLREASLDEGAALLYVELANGVVSEAAGSLTEPFPARVRAITLEVAARAYRNPDGYATEAIDDWRGGRSADTAEAGVYLTKVEARTLGRFTGSAGAYSIPLTSPLDLP